MKSKNFLSIICAVSIASLSLVGCSDYEPILSEGVENLSDKQLATLKEYTKNFTERYGNIDPNHTWGFGEFGNTRAFDDDGFGWGYTGYETFTSEDVADIVEQLPEGIDVDGKFNDYEFISNGEFVIYPVYGKTSASDQIGYYYYNPKTQHISDRTEVVFIEDLQNNIFEDEYVTQMVTTEYRKKEDWNNGGAHYWEESVKSKEYPWSSDIDDSNKTLQKTFPLDWDPTGDWGYDVYTVKTRGYYINVPEGYRVGFFLKNGDYTFYSNIKLNVDDNMYHSVVLNHTESGRMFFGLEDWEANAAYGHGEGLDCNDIVFYVKGVDGFELPDPIDPDDTEPEPGTKCRIMCEDLGSTSDFDFNDIVFDVVSYKQEGKLDDGSPAYTATILVQAAGGTLPVYIGSVDEANEVHHILLKNINGATGTPINVTKGGVRYPAQKHYVKNLPSQKPSDIPLYGKGTMAGSHDKEALRICENFRDLNIYAPQKICVPVTARWTIEHGDIGEAYTHFTDWVKKEKGNGGFEDGANWTDVGANDALLMSPNPTGDNSGNTDPDSYGH